MQTVLLVCLVILTIIFASCAYRWIKTKKELTEETGTLVIATDEDGDYMFLNLDVPVETLRKKTMTVFRIQIVKENDSQN